MQLISPLMILIVIALLIVAFGLYVLLYRKQRLGSKDITQIKKLWKEAETLLNEHPDKAVLKADKLLDHALGKAGYSGNLGEKLRHARSVLSDNNAIWSAHKLRNRIAHEIDITVSVQQAKTALKAFRKAFHDLGITL